MWKRNLLFGALCLIGIGAVTANLLSSSRIPDPPDARPVVESALFRETVEKVDSEFREHWRREALQFAPQADDRVIARRLALGLTGAIPSFDELRAFEAQPPEQRVQWMVSRLLDDRRSADYLAERFARSFVGTQNGPFLVYRRRRFVTWLSEQFQQNRPYDEIVRDLIADTGLWTDTPSVNFLTATLDENDDGRPDPIRLAGRTSRAFLGMRIDCLQCHDDNLGTVLVGDEDAQRHGTQKDFHQLAAYFSEAKASALGIRDDDQPYLFQYLGEEAEETVLPFVPFNAELLQPGETRRQQLARWVTHRENKPFSRAIVNRVWALMFGLPLVAPVDDMSLHGPFPPGLETLADAFSESGYDLKWLIRVIAATEAFQRSSRAPFDITQRHEDEFAAFPLTRLRPEQMAGSIIQASSLKTIDASSHIVVQLSRFGQQNDFILRYGDLGEDEFEDRGGTVTQRLMMMNGELTRERTMANPLLTAAHRIANLSPDDETAVSTAYLAILSRTPSREEMEYFVAELRDLPRNERPACLEDLYWILLNSTEFSWNH